MELIVFTRPPETDHGNLFVRLSKRTACHLSAIANDADCGNEDSYSLIHDAADFLPLEITIQVKKTEKITIYASYNGGSPYSNSSVSLPYRNGDTDNIIEIPLDLYPSLEHIFNSTSSPILASVQPISAPIATSVTIEPLTTSDWEMIEMEASVLEDGGLLNQITIVYLGQILPLRLIEGMGREGAAWVKVVDLGGALDHNEHVCSSSESDSESSSSFVDEVVNTESSIKCVRLMAETEVVVIPKPRVKEEKPKQSNNTEPLNLPSQPLRVQPTSSDFHHVHHELIESLPNPPVGHVFVHSSTIMDIPGYVQCCEAEASFHTVLIRKTNNPYLYHSNDTDNSDVREEITIAILCESDKAHEGHIALNPFLRHQLQLHLLNDWVTLQLLPDSFVTNKINNLRDSVADELETIHVAKVSLVFEKSRVPWRFPDGCCSLNRGTLTAILCKCCQRGNAKLEINTQQQASTANKTLFCRGSLIPADYLKNLGIELPKPMHNCYRVNFQSGISEQNGVGPILQASDIELMMNFATTEQSDAAISSTELPSSVVLSDDSIYTLGLSTASFGIAALVKTATTACSEIISCYSHTTQTTLSSSHRLFMGIAGEEGSGKSHCALHIASRLYLSQMCSVVYLGCKTLQSSPQTTLVSILQEIQRAFEEAKYRQPSVLILDDLDCLIPNVGSGDSDGDGSIQHQMTNPALVGQVKVIVDHLILLSRDCSIPADSSKMTTSQGVICLCTCKDKDTISSRLMEVMHSFVDVPSLDLDQRIEFLCRHLLGEAFSPNAVPHIISRLGRLTDGYRLRDLHLIVTRIRNSADLRDLHHSISKQTKDLSLDDMGTDIETILEDFIPLSQQSLNISHNESIVEWSSIGGLFRTKQSLHDIIIHPMKFRQVYDNAPTSLPTGLMLFGYPGCGKSFLVPSLAKRSHLNLITCRGPELLDRYIGASEAKVRQLFARTVAASPALLFFDDFDALAPQRGSDHTGVTDRVVNQLLTLLDGVERNTKAQVFVVVATSRPDKIDNALLRPGRLEKHVYVGYPESQSEWNSLFSSMLSTRSVDDEVRQLQQNEDLFSFFCKDLDHIKEFCAADLKAVLDTAHLMAVHDILATSKEETCEVKIGKQHISDAFRRTRPSLLAVDRARFVRYFEPFRSKYNVTKEIGSGWNNSSLMNGLNKGNDSSIKLKTSLR